MLNTSLLIVCLAFAALSLAMQAPGAEPAEEPTAETIETWEVLDVDGATLRFHVIEPAALDRKLAAPVLLALPPGAEDEAMVEAGLGLYWRALAESGWVVVSPAPRAEGGERASAGDGARFVALLELVAERYTTLGGRPHLAGISNGGRGAFHLAERMPERFLSMTCLPGMPPSETPNFEALASLPITLFVGELDEPWVLAGKRAHEALEQRGGASRFVVVPGEGHVVSPKAAAPIFAHFTELRERGKQRAAARADIAAVLDDLHAAAAEADEARYFDHFAPSVRGPVFIGTDANERWTLEEFRAFAHPYFAAGEAWTYASTARHVELDDASPDSAWFDELLTHASYGTLRGTGVLIRRAGRWRVAQYVLSFCVPNEVAADVVECISAGEPGGK